MTFSDYQGWGIDAGYRYFIDVGRQAVPFVSASIGFQRVQEITVSLGGPALDVRDVPFYGDSWVAQWRFGTGLIGSINDRLGWQVTLDLKYSGVLSDEAGIGTLGFERINNAGNRWTLPLMGGIFVNF